MINLYLLTGSPKSGKSHFLRSIGATFVDANPASIKKELAKGNYVLAIDDFIGLTKQETREFISFLEYTHHDGFNKRVYIIQKEEKFKVFDVQVVPEEKVTIIISMHEQEIVYIDPFILANAKRIKIGE